MKKLLIVGTGGLAREFTNWCSEKFEVIGYFSINKDEHAKFKLPGKLFTGELTPKATGAECALIAIGSPEAKKRYFSQLKESGFTFPSFVHSSSTVSKSAEVGEGTVIAPQCVIGPNTKLGQAIYVNFQVGIGHDAQIGDFVQINPGAQIGGLVTVGNSGTDRIRLDHTRKTLCRKQRDSRIRIILFRKSSRECNCHWKSRKTHESVRMRVRTSTAEISTAVLKKPFLFLHTSPHTRIRICPLDPKTKFLSLVPTPGEIAPQYQTTVISSDDVAATAALKGSHEQGAPACSS